MSKLRVLRPSWWRAALNRLRQSVNQINHVSNTINHVSNTMDTIKGDLVYHHGRQGFLSLSWFGWTGISKVPEAPSQETLVPGSIKQRDVLRPDYLYWISQLGLYPRIHNKLWQYVTLLHNAWLHFGDASQPKRTAIVFGVGTEPTVAYLASLGWQVTATDYFDGDIAATWQETDQLVTSLSDLNANGLCAPDTFAQRVRLLNMDMNDIPADFDGKYDLVWSLCALGHIGGYENGLDFIKRSAKLLKKGGLAVHTTEMDSSVDLDRLGAPNLSLYRRGDLEGVLEWLSQEGYSVPSHDLDLGEGALDTFVDVSPYRQHPHVRLDVLGHVTTPTSLVFSRKK